MNDARGLRASRSRDAEAGGGNVDCERHSWLQQHGWGIRKFVTDVTSDLRQEHANGKRK